MPELTARTKATALYFGSFLLFTLFIFLGIYSHLNLLRYSDMVHEDVKQIFQDMTELTMQSVMKNMDYDKGKTTINRDEKLKKLLQTQFGKYEKELSELREYYADMRSGKYAVKVNENAIVPADLALGSLGGQVVHVSGKPYKEFVFPLSFFGLDYFTNNPKKILQDTVTPGECYAFSQSSCNFTIKLISEVTLDAVSVTHITQSMSPSGNLSSAPKEFSVFGLREKFDNEEFYFGTFTYNVFIHRSMQTFNLVHHVQRSFRYVKFAFLSNHGNPEFTCIYRVSVHGKADLGL